MDAPKRTPLSERIRPQTAGKPDDLFDISRLYLETLANDIAALEQECEHQREIINGSDHLSRIAELGQERDNYIDGLRHELKETRRLRAAIREALECADEDEVTERHQDGTICGICVKRLRRALTKPEGES